MANLDQSFIKAYGQGAADTSTGRGKASPDDAVNVAEWYSASVIDTSTLSDSVPAAAMPVRDEEAVVLQPHARFGEPSSDARRIARSEKHDKPERHFADQAAALRPMARRYGTVRAAEAQAAVADPILTRAPLPSPPTTATSAPTRSSASAATDMPTAFRAESFAVDSLHVDVCDRVAACAPRPAPATEAPSLCHRACTVQFTSIGAVEFESTSPATMAPPPSESNVNRVPDAAARPAKTETAPSSAPAAIGPATRVHAPEPIRSPIAKSTMPIAAPAERDSGSNISVFKPIGPTAGETAINVAASPSWPAKMPPNASIAPGAPHPNAVQVPASKPQTVAAAAHRPAAPSSPDAEPFQPGFEVDQFRWPALVVELGQKSTTALSGMIDELVNASSAGRGRVMFAGGRRGAGVTTLALYAARRAAELGLSVALVDGDFAKPAVARSLGVAPTRGFEDVLAGRIDLCGALIASVADRLTLLPLRGSCFDLAQTNAAQVAPHLATLQRHFALVIIDGGPLADCAEPWLKTAGENAIDSGIIVHDVRHDLAMRNAHRPSLTYPAIGVVENFVR